MATQKKADMLDIIKHEVESIGGNFDEFYDYLAKEIQNGKVRILRHGDSLMIYEIVGQGAAEGSIATLDKPEAIAQALQSFFQALKIAGFKSFSFDSDESKYVPLLEMAKIPFHMDDASKKIVIEVQP